RERELHELGATFVHFSAQTRMSGVDLPMAAQSLRVVGGDAAGGPVRQVRKGAADAIRRHVAGLGATFPPAVDAVVDAVARAGGTPLVVSDGARVLGVIEL